MVNLKLQLPRHLFSHLYTKLIALLSACSEDVDLVEDVQIEGGHQVQRVDGDFEFRY
ncbi:MAG: hypothetical protein ACJAXX_000983 [Roseivirga sp.]|jgi:hypothetical protein